MSLPLSQGVSQLSAIVPVTVPGDAARFPGASGAVAARLLVTVVSASDTASLFAASLIGLLPGFA